MVGVRMGSIESLRTLLDILPVRCIGMCLFPDTSNNQSVGACNAVAIPCTDCHSHPDNSSNNSQLVSHNAGTK